METIKLATGITIVVICLTIFVLIACAKFFHVRKPGFLIDNLAEIAILTFVSLLMGFLIIIS